MSAERVVLKSRNSLRRVVALGSVISSSSSVRSRCMEGGGSRGLRKWLIVSNWLIEIWVVKRYLSWRKLAPYLVIETFSRRTVFMRDKSKVREWQGPYNYRLHHLPVYLRFPSYSACTVETAVNQPFQPSWKLWVTPPKKKSLTTFECSTIFFTIWVEPDIRKSRPCWK